MKKLACLAVAFCFCHILIAQDIYKAIGDNENTLPFHIAAKGGNTVLMNVAASGTVSIVELLLEHGADINDENESGQTALSVCGWSRNPDDISKFLVMNGANVNPKERKTMRL